MKRQTILSLLLIFLGISTVFSQSNEIFTEEQLNLSLDELMDLDVVTTSKISTTNTANVPSVVTVVTAKDIKYSGAKSMEEVLRQVAGLDVVKQSLGPNTTVGVRGLYSTSGTNNKILFLINGHPFRSNLSGDASVFLGNYPLNHIEQIEIIRGPGSTLFGAGAFLAVINIKTKKTTKDVEVSANVGSFNTREVSALTTLGGKNDWHLSLGGNYMTTEGPDITIENDFASEFLPSVSQSVGYTSPVSAAPGRLNYGRNTLNFNLTSGFKDFYLLGGYMRSNDQPTVGALDAITQTNAIINTGSFTELGYKKALNNNAGELVVKTYYDHFGLDSETDLWSAESTQLFNAFTELRHRDPSIPDEPTFYQPDEAQIQRTLADNSTIGGEINIAYNFKNNVKILTGAILELSEQTNVERFANGNVIFTQNIVDETGFYVPNEAFGGMKDLSEYNWIQEAQRRMFAAFGQAEFDFKNIFCINNFTSFSLIAGVRYDQYSDVGDAVNPRGALLFSPTKKVFFKILYGEAFRAPSFAELFTINNNIAGNPNLIPEEVATVEGVIGFRPNKDSEITISYFNTRITNNINFTSDPDPNIFLKYQNVGTLETSGIELDYRYTFMDDAYAFGSVTYQTVLDVSQNLVFAQDSLGELITFNQENFNPGGVPNMILNLGVNYPIHEYVNLNINGNYLSERQRSEEQVFEFDQTPTVSTGNIVRRDAREAIPSRLLLNASLLIHNIIPGMELQFSGYNLTNAENYNPTTMIRSEDIRRAGTNFLTTLRYRF